MASIASLRIVSNYCQRQLSAISVAKNLQFKAPACFSKELYKVVRDCIQTGATTQKVIFCHKNYSYRNCRDTDSY